MSHHSLSQFVKKIPDEAQDKSQNLNFKISNRAQIFLQQATLACLSRSAKKQFFSFFCKKSPKIQRKISIAYQEMVNSFNTCQQYLNGQRFTVIYDENSLELQEAFADEEDARPRVAGQ